MSEIQVKYIEQIIKSLADDIELLKELPIYGFQHDKCTRYVEIIRNLNKDDICSYIKYRNDDLTVPKISNLLNDLLNFSFTFNEHNKELEEIINKCRKIFNVDIFSEYCLSHNIMNLSIKDQIDYYYLNKNAENYNNEKYKIEHTISRFQLNRESYIEETIKEKNKYFDFSYQGSCILHITCLEDLNSLKKCIEFIEERGFTVE